ncbi:hypothetical protein EL22_26055 [Halostagnicola sp. A56]|nr:hypothetical protein EL22_26055 [Halostagnicola sp. A56]
MYSRLVTSATWAIASPQAALISLAVTSAGSDASVALERRSEVCNDDRRTVRVEFDRRRSAEVTAAGDDIHRFVAKFTRGRILSALTPIEPRFVTKGDPRESHRVERRSIVR